MWYVHNCIIHTYIRKLQCISLFIYSAGYIRNYVIDGLSSYKLYHMMLLAAKSISSLTVSYPLHYHLKHKIAKKLINLLRKLELKIFAAYKITEKVG